MSKLRVELGACMPQPARMPTRAELSEAGRMDLVYSIVVGAHRTQQSSLGLCAGARMPPCLPSVACNADSEMLLCHFIQDDQWLCCQTHVPVKHEMSRHARLCASVSQVLVTGGNTRF